MILHRLKQGAVRWTVLGLATVGFVGWAPYHLVPFRKLKGGGFLGTLAGWGLLWVLPTGPWFILLTLGMIVLAVAVSDKAEQWLTHDDPRIVIDEVAGVWVAAIGITREPVALITIFIAFRFFDVFKGPWGRAAARLPGGWGIVADDVLAGLIANGLARLLMQG
ncbi:MAG: phosphatidylglycerophosphatase A [Elusimicrobia bacterium]|nr:phosphatidylglycerophosphatase A [Elusimicrobiota bacterium]